MRTNLRIAHRIENSRIVTAGSKFQGYINIGIQQISWVTGKIPEFGWTITLIERFWITELSNSWIGGFTIGAIFGAFVFGYVWKKSGTYARQTTEQAMQNPVSEKMLLAAEIIIKNEGKKIK